MTKTESREYRSLSFRIWHWFNALAITGLLLTVLIRKTLLSWRTNSVVISSKLEAAGHSIPTELAVDLAKTIRNPLWDWHIWLGYILGALLIIRFLIAIVGKKRTKNNNHSPVVKFLYVVFHLMTALMVITGLLLIFKKDLGQTILSMAGLLKEIHEVSMWFFVGFIIVHIAGVIRAEYGESPGIVSDMISGGKE